MCNDEALNVVICSMNANIDVVVHKDLHEINLLNVKKMSVSTMPAGYQALCRSGLLFRWPPSVAPVRSVIQLTTSQ
jgi:hypothetical protein